MHIVDGDDLEVARCRIAPLVLGGGVGEAHEHVHVLKEQPGLEDRLDASEQCGELRLEHSDGNDRGAGLADADVAVPDEQPDDDHRCAEEHGAGDVAREIEAEAASQVCAECELILGVAPVVTLAGAHRRDRTQPLWLRCDP